MPVKNAARTERRKGDAVTIHEVARHAGVSPMTVSRVMNSNSNVREATRELVMRAVRELNYTPNAAARSLAAAQGTRIALIYTNPSAAYLSELLVGALAGAARTAAQLVLDTWDHMSHPSYEYHEHDPEPGSGMTGFAAIKYTAIVIIVLAILAFLAWYVVPAFD